MLPKADEFDRYPYLPSARSIQRTFGGLIGLKKELNVVDNDYHRGGRADELAVSKMLVKLFGEVAVHEQGAAGEDNKERFDFIVYYKDGKFAVDTFYPSTVGNLAKIVCIKAGKSNDFNGPIYLVVRNVDITGDVINHLISNKTQQLKSNLTVLTYKDFFERIQDYPVLTIT